MEGGGSMMIDPAWKAWYRAKHDQLCRVSADAFESYVTQVLTRFHPDFVNPDPMGRLGDRGCDGLAEAGTILYACYGQRATTGIEDKVTAKLESDFTRGLANWISFTTWRFVTNSLFGTKATAKLTELRQQHNAGSVRPLTLDLWRAPDDLWSNVVNKLTPEQLDEIMPGVPHARNVELSDMVELIQTLEDVPEDIVDAMAQIRPVPYTKMDYNQLPATTKAEFNEGRLLSHRIATWFAEQADPGLRDTKARSFRAVYEEARRATSDVREMVRAVYGALGGSDFDMSTRRANAVYAVTVYFFDSCDIFEEPPPGYGGGDRDDAAAN
jgi:hypothetical protein